MLSLCELRRSVRIIQNRVLGARLRRVVPQEALKLVLSFDTSSDKMNMLLACGPDNARISLAGRVPDSLSSPSSFHEYVKAHLTGGTLKALECSSDNRQVRLVVQSHSGSFSLILSILGGRSNLYLLDAEEKLVHAVRPLDETRNELKIGGAWVEPGGSVPSGGIDRWRELPDEQFLDAIEQTYVQLELRLSAERLGRRILQSLKKEKAYLDRKLINLQEDLGEAKQADSYRHKGELLKSVLHTIRPGDDKVTAADFETGKAVEIQLDPTASPAANLELYFARYQKQSRGELMIQQQLDEAGTARAELETIGRNVEEAMSGELPDIQALERIGALPAVRKLVQRYFPERKPARQPARSATKREVPSRLLPKRYKTEDGLEIWVGRNDESNDYLTTRLARGNDLFFHLEGYPGSHVVLRTEGRSDPPPKSILDACELAVHYSKLKNASRADVHMAPIKDIKKPRGAKAGLVYVRSGKTIHLRRDPKRLQGILASRLD